MRDFGKTINFNLDSRSTVLNREMEEKEERTESFGDSLQDEFAGEDYMDDFSEKRQYNENRKKLIDDSNYLRYIAEMRKADSDLALAKAESAELILQMNNFKKHYEEFEKLTHRLIRKNQSIFSGDMKNLIELSEDIKNDSETLSMRIDGEIQRLTDELSRSIEGNVKELYTEELEKINEATSVLYDYSEKVKGQYIRFQKLEKLKLVLFVLSSISSPLVLILMILGYLHII